MQPISVASIHALQVPCRVVSSPRTIMTEDASPNSEHPEDDWDLDDDDLSLGESITPTPRLLPNQRQPQVKAPAPRAREIAPAETAPAAAPKPEPLAKTPSEPEITARSVRKEKKTSSQSRSSSPSSFFEKISITTVLLCLAGVFAWGLSSYYSEAPEGELVEFTETFPAEGTSVSIAAVETWWREPVREGENQDEDVVIEAQLIPCASITLAASGSTILQASFRDGENNLIGDSINLVVKDGRFTKNGDPTIEIHATAGFRNAPDLHPYLNGDIDPWSLVITEEDTPEPPVVKARVGSRLLPKN